MLILLVDLIFEYCATVIIFIASIFMYVLLLSRVLPGLMLSPKPDGAICDRGIRKCVFEGGRGITYEPKLSVRRYISQYVLFSENGGKYIKCKINEKVSSLRYELVIYDRKNKAVERLEISENVETEGYMAKVMLPPETSFVHLCLRAVNGEALKEKEAELYEGKRVVGFWAAAFFLTLFEALFANYVVVLFSDVLLGYFKAVPEVDAVLPILVIIAVSAITATVVLFANMASPFKLAWDKSGKKKAEKN